MSPNLIFGTILFAFGLLSLVLRFVSPESRMFSKLGPMRERFGHKAGTAIHWGAYTVLPLVIGGQKLARVLLESGQQ